MVDVAPAEDPPRPQRKSRWATRRRRVLLLAGLIVLVVIGYFAVTFLEVWHDMSADETPQAGAIVVLGAAQYNGRPSPVLEARLAHALALYQAGKAPLLVVTGGRRPGDRYTEATAGYDWLRKQGVPDRAILKEVQGRDTWESMSAVAGFLRPRHVSDVILVSDPTHSLRLREIAGELGLEAHVSPQRTIPYSFGLEVHTMLRETVAVGAGRIIGYRRLSHFVG